MDGPRILAVGYSGANNTGAEALLRADIEDVRAVLGGDARITVPSLNPANLRRYLREGPDLRIVPIPTIFVRAIRELVRRSDVVLLVEGSAYMDTWTSALLWFFLWATRCAHAAGKPCLAYAVDAGELSPWNRLLVRRVASSTDLIVTRSEAAARRLREWGVTAPIRSTADNAFTFATDPHDDGWPAREWPVAADGAVGLAPVDFFRFPVVIRPWGRREDRYRWPYSFSTSRRRSRAGAVLAEGYARVADRIVERHGRPVALIAMEELDERLCRTIAGAMRHGDRARVFSSREYDASQIAVLLRGLRLLVTSRYHAAILSLAGRVPQIAVGHDLRLSSLYDELGLQDSFLRPRSPAVFARLDERIDELLTAPAGQAVELERGYREHVERARGNRDLLRAFLADHGWEAARWAA
ncbi:MAG TPA: polysaccharide pyruvyl transferase family protein [Actinomycetota bacterium]|nr:polysaccharide pyruvyl transferase family protein [Actinomycetota bacterium]